MTYRLAFQRRNRSMVEHTWCADVIETYSLGCRVLRDGGTVFDINAGDPKEHKIAVDDLLQAIASEDFYRAEYARVGIDYPSMQSIEP